MGEPAEVSDSDRTETRTLAAAILESVCADEAMPHGLDSLVSFGGNHAVYLATDVEQLLFRLAQEVMKLETENTRMRPVWSAAKKWRERIRDRPIAAQQGVVVGLADELVAAIDAAAAATATNDTAVASEEES